MNNRIQQLVSKRVEAAFKRESNAFNAHLNGKDLKKLADDILDEVADVVMNCDPSTKLVPHKPYTTICKAIHDHFYNEVEDDG